MITAKCSFEPYNTIQYESPILINMLKRGPKRWKLLELDWIKIKKCKFRCGFKSDGN